MTPRERAKEATWEAGCPDWGRDDQERLETAVEQAITAAVEAEREECAKICDGQEFWHKQMNEAAWSIARQIRARSTASTQDIEMQPRLNPQVQREFGWPNKYDIRDNEALQHDNEALRRQLAEAIQRYQDLLRGKPDDRGRVDVST